MIDRNNYFYLNTFIQVIRGIKNAAIYNLDKGEIYSIDGRLADVISNNKAKKIEEMIKEADFLGISQDELLENLEKLFLLRLGNFYPQKVFIDRFKEPFNKEDFNRKDKIYLENVWIKLTNECNLNCLMCSNKNYNKICYPCQKNPLDTSQFDLTSIQKILDEAILFECSTIRYTGGNPLLLGNDLFEILDYSNKLNFKSIELYSNLEYLDEEQKLKLKKIKNLTLLTPIFSLQKIIHDKITGKKGSFEKSFKNILDLKEQGIKIKILLPILNVNKESLEETITYLKKNNLNFFQYSSLNIENKAPKSIIPENEFIINTNKIREINYDKFFKNKYWNPCWAFSIAINPNGDLKNCFHSDIIIGNIFNDSLREVLREYKFGKYWHLSKDKIKICKDCEFRYACLDCRVAAKNIGGEFTSKYPFCSYNPEKN